jgi:peptide deformylase
MLRNAEWVRGIAREAGVRMALRPIVLLGDPILRQKAKRVTRFDESVQQLIDDMIDTMRDAPGTGLAAPQVGVPLRISVIEVDEKVTVLCNPEIVEMEGEYEPEEGCLSIPGYVANVKRALKVTVKGKNRRGKEIKIKAGDLLAHAIQHEVDHLNGILFIDRLSSLDLLRKVPPPPEVEEGEEETAKAETAQTTA